MGTHLWQRIRFITAVVHFYCRLSSSNHKLHLFCTRFELTAPEDLIAEIISGFHKGISGALNWDPRILFLN